MFCRSCGTKMPDGVRFCPQCGTQVAGNARPGQQPYGGQGPQQPQGRNAGRTAPRQAGPRQTVPRQAAPRQTIPRQASLRQNAPQQTARGAAKAGKKAGGGLMKFAAVAAAGVIGVAGISAMMDGTGGGGGGYDPPVVSTSRAYNGGGSSNGSGSSGGSSGGTSSGKTGQTGNAGSSGKSGQGSAGQRPPSANAQTNGRYDYYLWQTYDYDGDNGGVDTEIVRLEFDESGRQLLLHTTDSDGDVDETLVFQYNPSTGEAVLRMSEDDASGEMRIRVNADGTLSGVVSASGEDGEGATYTKFTGLTGNPESFTVSTTGESTNYMGFHYREAEMTDRLFLAEAQQYISENGLYYREKGKETEAFSNNPGVSRPPAHGKIDPPADILEYYVKVEAQNRVREWAAGEAGDKDYRPSRVTLPSDWNITQEEFDAMVEAEMSRIKGQ